MLESYLITSCDRSQNHCWV